MKEDKNGENNRENNEDNYGYDLSILENWKIDKTKILDGKRRTVRVTIKLTEKEMAILKMRMVFAHKKSMSDFIRKLIVEGEIKTIDTEPLREYARQLSAVGNNINQIAKNVNTSGNLRHFDFTQLQTFMNEIKTSFYKMYEELSAFRK